MGSTKLSISSLTLFHVHVKRIIYGGFPHHQISLWNAVTIYFASRRFMIAINISINDLLNYNFDRYLPTQLQGGVTGNLWCHLSMFHTLVLTARASWRCVPWYDRCSRRMLFQPDLTSFVTVMSSFNFRRPDIWLIRLVFMVAISSHRLELNKSFHCRNGLFCHCHCGSCHYANQQPSTESSFLYAFYGRKQGIDIADNKINVM